MPAGRTVGRVPSQRWVPLALPTPSLPYPQQGAACHQLLRLKSACSYLAFHPSTSTRSKEQTGYVERQAKEGEQTATGMQKETFGEGSAAQSAAGKKGELVGCG